LVFHVGKHKLCVLESISFGDCNGKPDNVQEEINHDNKGRRTEDPFEGFGTKIVGANADEKDDFRDDPLNGTELDVGGVGSKVEAKDADFREEKVGCRLAVGGHKGGPGSGGPPGDEKPKETAVTWTSGFSGPAERVRFWSLMDECLQVDGACGWQSRADFGEDGGSVEHKDASDKVARPGLLDDGVMI
jgi:hypothetical protein